MTPFNNPTVLLLDEAVNCDGSLTKTWLEKNGCQVRQIDSVFDAIELITDITSDCRPSFVLMNSGESTGDSAETMQMLHDLSDSHELPIYAIASNESRNFEAQNSEFSNLIEDLESLRPLISNLQAASYAKAA